MADAQTANYGWIKPEVTQSASTWGNKLNSDLDAIDAQLFATAGIAAAALPASGGTMTGAITSAVAINSDQQLPNRAQAKADALAIVKAYLPAGCILKWSGSVASIPANWRLCDGTGGTPDLRNKFIIGAGDAYNPGDNGGALHSTLTITIAGTAITQAQLPNYTLPLTDPGHLHGVTDPGHQHSGSASTGGPGAAGGGPYQFGGYAQSVNSNTTGLTVNKATTGISVALGGSGQTHTHTASGTVDSLPPYYALAFIMRVDA